MYAILITVGPHICWLFDYVHIHYQLEIPGSGTGQRKTLHTATSLAYLNRIPRFTVSVPFPELSHSTRRRVCSSSLTSQSIVLFSESITTLSPSRTSAIGPPRRASGTTWPVPVFFCHISFRFTPTGPLRLRTDDEASGRPGEAPIGDKRGRTSQPRTYQRGGGALYPKTTVTSIINERALMIRPSRV